MQNHKRCVLQRLIYLARVEHQCLEHCCGHITFAIRGWIGWRQHLANPFSLEMRNQHFHRQLEIHINRKIQCQIVKVKYERPTHKVT